MVHSLTTRSVDMVLAALLLVGGVIGAQYGALLATRIKPDLLRLALSRTRELDADATALELTGDWQALIAALDKLERHHSGFAVHSLAARDDGSMRLLRSHPATSERVGALLNLA